MAQEPNFCLDGGWLVSSKQPLPDWPFAYKWTRQIQGVGCNNLRCTACGSTVLWRLDIEHPKQPAAEVYQRWQAGTGEDPHANTWARTYACRCHIESQQGSNPAPVTDENWGTTTPWQCAGHPPLLTPATVLGMTMGLDNWDEAVEHLAHLRKSLPKNQNETIALPLGTVMAALRGADREEFGQALLRAVRHSDLVVRCEAVKAFTLLDVWPQWPRALAKLVIAEPRWTLGQVNPEWPTESLDWWAARAITAIAPPTSPERADIDRAVTVLRRVVLAPGGGQFLTQALCDLDPQWSAEHVVEMLPFDAQAGNSVLYALAGQPKLRDEAAQRLQAATVH